MGNQNFWLERGVVTVVIGVIVAIAFSVLMPRKSENSWTFGDSRVCRFPAIYNFGDSNSDTGGRSATYLRIPSPYGNSFFGKSSGRFSDGQVVIDFIGMFYSSMYNDSGYNLYVGISDYFSWFYEDCYSILCFDFLLDVLVSSKTPLVSSAKKFRLHSHFKRLACFWSPVS